MLKVIALAGAMLTAWSMTASVSEGSAPGQGCADSVMAANRLAHVLPLFADTTPEAVEWRAEGGIQRTRPGDAEVVRDAGLCARIDEQARAWHAQAADVSVFGNYSVYALRLGGYYAAVVDYPDENGTGWSTLLILAPDDLRVLDYGVL